MRSRLKAAEARSDTQPMPLRPDAETKPQKRKARFGISLFWRTFLLLAVLLVSSALGWYELFRTLEYEPRLISNTRQIASVVNLARASLLHTDAIERVALVKELADRERLRVQPREPDDEYEPYSGNGLEEQTSHELRALLGPETVIARSVNGETGLWVGFAIRDDSYWLRMEGTRLPGIMENSTWMLWFAILGALSLLGAAVLANFINKPLKRLLEAVAHVRAGEYQLAHLDDNARSAEIREVNAGFNRMAAQLAEIQRDRDEMLAGISHDLRTPLARLRLECEMSVPDASARADMVADINQVDMIIGKFLDSARPEHMQLQPVRLAGVIFACARPFSGRPEMHVRVNVPPDCWVMGDEVELSRVISNLLENARRYGASRTDGVTHVRIGAAVVENQVRLQIRDRGPGVPQDQLVNLTRPFYRGDSARTSATGAGLGLSIVAKIVSGMGGALRFENRSTGGLVVTIDLRKADPPRRRNPPRKGR